MSPGSLVRFKKALKPPASPVWLIGLLVEFDSSTKMSIIMHKDNLYEIPINNVQRYGKRYLEAAS